MWSASSADGYTISVCLSPSRLLIQYAYIEMSWFWCVCRQFHNPDSNSHVNKIVVVAAAAIVFKTYVQLSRWVSSNLFKIKDILSRLTIWRLENINDRIIFKSLVLVNEQILINNFVCAYGFSPLQDNASITSYCLSASLRITQSVINTHTHILRRMIMIFALNFMPEIKLKVAHCFGFTYMSFIFSQFLTMSNK